MLDELIVATGNAGKLSEIRRRLSSTKVRGLRDLDVPVSIVEDAETFEGNALKKVEAVVSAVHRPCLSDDSGLEVDALEGRPGVYSARFGGEELSDEQRCIYLLDALRTVPEALRTARFRAVLAYLVPNAQPVFFHGTLEGKIASSPAGNNGFGYDPVFIPVGYETPLAVLDPSVKSRISHRAQALDKFEAFIASMR